MEPTPQQQPKTLHWQCLILNLLGCKALLFFFLTMFIAIGQERVEGEIIHVRYYSQAESKKEVVGMILQKHVKGAELRPQI